MLRKLASNNLLKQAGCWRQGLPVAGICTEASESKVYELRTYSLVPQKVGEFMKLSNEKFHLRTQHSVLLGYWTTELGGLNQVVHLWEYGSLSERAGVRAKLGGDPEWQAEYFQKILPWLQHQDNITLSRMANVSEVDMTKPSGGGYELWQLDMTSLPGQWSPLVLQAVNALENSQRQVCGVYKSELGDMNSVVLIWRHNNIDQVQQLKLDLFNSKEGGDLWSHVKSSKSKFLAPTQFSNWK